MERPTVSKQLAALGPEPTNDPDALRVWERAVLTIIFGGFEPPQEEDAP